MKHPIPFIARRAARWALALLALLLPMLAPAQQVTYFHTDALGSTVMESNEAGAVTYSRDFRPYGEHVIGATKDGPGFTGHVTDTVTGLSYMQQRYYDPGVGRFLSVDPVTVGASGDRRHLNRYVYSFNNPYAYSDPDGRVPVVVVACAASPPCAAAAIAGGAYATYKVQQALNDHVLPLLERQLNEAADEDPNGPFTTEDKERSKKGADGGESVITTETDGGGETSSTTHTVTVDGEVVHQHTDHHGREGSRRRFPQEWTRRGEKGEGKHKPVPEDRGPTPPRPEPRPRERWPQR